MDAIKLAIFILKWGLNWEKTEAKDTKQKKWYLCAFHWSIRERMWINSDHYPF